LDVSTKRISELVRLGKINRFDFLGRTYVSMREVGERYQQELKAGRPRRAVGKRVVALIKAEALRRRSLLDWLESPLQSLLRSSTPALIPQEPATNPSPTSAIITPNTRRRFARPKKLTARRTGWVLYVSMGRIFEVITPWI
jgi:hypothetical protein